MRSWGRLTWCGLAGLGILASGCSSGGGSSGGGIVLNFVSGSSGVTEDDPAFAIAVELEGAGAGLATEVTVDVEITGSATAGDDFTVLSATTITFPAESQSGDRQEVSLQPVADSLTEPPEDIELRLTNVSTGARIGYRPLHTVELEDTNTATVRFATASSATVDESAADHGVEIELALAGGDELGVALSVEVYDADAGSATSGSDYASFPATTLTFPAGSTDGESRSVLVGVLSDDEVEGDENVVLRLQDPSIEGTILEQLSHDVTVTDDDVAGSAFLSVRLGDAQTTAHSGDTLDVGAASMSGPEQDGELVTVSNLGNDALDLDTPEVIGDEHGEFKVTVEEGPLAGSMNLPGAEVIRPMMQSADLGTGLIEVVVDPGASAMLSEPARATWHDVPLPDGTSVDLELERVRFPWSADAVIFIDGAPSAQSPAEMTEGLGLWRGRVAGVEHSNVFLAASSSGIDGWIRVGDGSESHFHLGTMQPETGTVWVASEERLLAEIGSPPPLCAGVRGPDGAPGPGAPGTGDYITGGGAEIAECRLAIETDYQFFQKLGSEQAATEYATSLIAAVSNVYLADNQATLSIAYLGIHTNANDGWNTPDGPGSTSQMLDEFQEAWAPFHGGSWPVEADLATFMSGASMGGGIAYVGVLCNDNYGFSVTANLHGMIDWDTFDYGVSGLSWDFVVVAHELGHNFGALHTHDYCPSLDRCQPTCEGSAQCGHGTLMSYCHLCPGGFANLELRFHPFIANVIRSRINSSCLEAADLGPGEYLTYRVRLVPHTTGAKAATMHLGHDAANEPVPFVLELVGQGTN